VCWRVRPVGGCEYCWPSVRRTAFNDQALKNGAWEMRTGKNVGTVEARLAVYDRLGDVSGTAADRLVCRSDVMQAGPPQVGLSPSHLYVHTRISPCWLSSESPGLAPLWRSCSSPLSALSVRTAGPGRARASLPCARSGRFCCVISV